MCDRDDCEFPCKHKWVGHCNYILGEPDDWICYCDLCGMEKPGSYIEDFMVKLVDLNPEWINHGDRKGLGVAFDCMIGIHEYSYNGVKKKCEIRNWILFVNPLDGGESWPGHSRSLILALRPNEDDRTNIAGCGTCRWNRSGDTF